MNGETGLIIFIVGILLCATYGLTRPDSYE